MDFGLSDAEQAFAGEVRAFLRAHPADTFPEDGTDARLAQHGLAG